MLSRQCSLNPSDHVKQQWSGISDLCKQLHFIWEEKQMQSWLCCFFWPKVWVDEEQWLCVVTIVIFFPFSHKCSLNWYLWIENWWQLLCRQKIQSLKHFLTWNLDRSVSQVLLEWYGNAGLCTKKMPKLTKESTEASNKRLPQITKCWWAN